MHGLGYVHDFIYFFFKVGLIEEITKTIPFLIFYFVFKKQLDEPVDYVIFFCVSALGFSAGENTFYFMKYGDSIIKWRAILSSVGHMLDTGLIAYGVIRYKFHSKKYGIVIMFIYLLLAAFAHGVFDFVLNFGSIGVLLSIIVYFYMVSFFATVLNNAMNLSPYFSYKKVINSEKVFNRLILYYGILIVIEFLVVAFHQSYKFNVEKGLVLALFDLASGIYLTAVTIIALCSRLSRFKLIKGRWDNLKFEFPFYITFGGDSSLLLGRSRLRIHVKGNSFDESYLSIFYEEYVRLYPMSTRRSYLGEMHITYIERKLFLKNDDIYYLAKVFDNDLKENYEYMLL